VIVLAPYNSTTYFLYRGEAMGYEYELLKDFAKDAGVELRVVLVQDRDSMMTMLRAGKGDIVAARLIPLPRDSGRVAYTRELYRSEPVLVQQKGPVSKAVAGLPSAVDTILKKANEALIEYCSPAGVRHDKSSLHKPLAYQIQLSSAFHVGLGASPFSPLKTSRMISEMIS